MQSAVSIPIRDPGDEHITHVGSPMSFKAMNSLSRSFVYASSPSHGFGAALE
jgi:hypothetical protein